MKLIKHGKSSASLRQVLKDHRLNWRDKGIYADLIELPNGAHVDLIEFSTHSTDSLAQLKTGIKQLIHHHYLVINDSSLVISSINQNNQQLATKQDTKQIIKRHDQHLTNRMLRNQWLIVWHHDDAQVVQALNRLARYLNPEMVLYGIQCSKKHCHSYRESLPYLNQLIMKWKHHRLTKVNSAQQWMNHRKLKSKPWNSEVQNRIFSSQRRTTLNNVPIKREIPDVFKHHK